ncbi:MAG: hypothetical protein ACLGHV_13390, partial [Gammaproteobacteria bacterium]
PSPFLSRCAREGGRPQRGGAALARGPLGWTAPDSYATGDATHHAAPYEDACPLGASGRCRYEFVQRFNPAIRIHIADRLAVVVA